MSAPLEFETNAEVEAVRALERFRDELKRVESDAYDWKWAIFAGHNAVQNFMVAGLDSPGREALFTRNHNRDFEKWWHAQGGAGKPPQPKLDYFMELYGKLKTPFDAREDMDAVNYWRNDFMHFLYSTWAISVRPLPRRFLSCLRVVEHVGWNPGSFRWEDGELKPRAQTAHGECVAALERLRKAYEP